MKQQVLDFGPRNEMVIDGVVVGHEQNGFGIFVPRDIILVEIDKRRHQNLVRLANEYDVSFDMPYDGVRVRVPSDVLKGFPVGVSVELCVIFATKEQVRYLAYRRCVVDLKTPTLIPIAT